MAKVTITIEDVEGKSGAVAVNFQINPEVPEGALEENSDVKPTPAQAMAMYLNQVMMNASSPGPDEEETAGNAEGCSQTGEDTCCGGNCHADSTEA